MRAVTWGGLRTFLSRDGPPVSKGLVLLQTILAARLSLVLGFDCLRLTARLNFSHHSESGKRKIR